MASSVNDILLKLKSNEYAPVYWLEGEEPFFMDQVSDYIEKNAIPEESKSFNLMVMYGKDVKVNDILMSARRFPMMSERQVVIVKEAKDIGDIKTEKGQELLNSYLENPTLSTILVFSHKYGKVDGRSSLSKSLKKNSEFLSTKRLYENQVSAWIQQYVRGLDRTISPHVAQIVVDHNGNDLEKITNEIAKIVEALPNENEINENAVYKYVGINKEFNNFEMINAVLLKDILKANQIANYYALNPRKHPIIPLLALMFSAFQKLLVVHQCKVLNLNDRDTAGKAGIPPFLIKEYLIGASNYSPGKVNSIIEEIHQSDLRSKGIDSPTFSDGELLRELIFRIMH